MGDVPGSGPGGDGGAVGPGALDEEGDKRHDVGEDADRRVASGESRASLGQRRHPEDGTDDQVENSDGGLSELAPRVGVVATTTIGATARLVPGHSNSPSEVDPEITGITELYNKKGTYAMYRNGSKLLNHYVRWEI